MKNGDWQLKRTMSATQFKRIVKELGMSKAAAGRYIGVSLRRLRRITKGSRRYRRVRPCFCIRLWPTVKNPRCQNGVQSNRRKAARAAGVRPSNWRFQMEASPKDAPQWAGCR